MPRRRRVGHGNAVVGLACTLWVMLAVAAPAWAHPLDPVLLELRERESGAVEVTWKASRAQVPGVELFPVFPNECRPTSDVETVDDDDASISRWTMVCEGGTVAGLSVGVSGLESTDALLRVELASGLVDRRVLSAAHPAATIAEAPGAWRVLQDYVRLGTDHIAGGLDHLLFVFGLLLLAPTFRSLLATITAFTAGHSLTLAAAALGAVSVAQAPVEVVIAATIYLLAVELARPPGPTLLRRRPWAMAFSFGLLHGLGFAGALRQAGLPQGDVPLALLSFNVGIEIGQIAFVVAMLALGAAARGFLERLPLWLNRVPVYAMGTASAYWILARTLP